MAGSATVEKRLDFGLLGPLRIDYRRHPGAIRHPSSLGCASHVGHQPQQARRSRRPNPPSVATLGRTRGSTPCLICAKLSVAPGSTHGWCCTAPPGYRLSIPDNARSGAVCCRKTAGDARGRRRPIRTNQPPPVGRIEGMAWAQVLDDLPRLPVPSNPFATALVEDKVLAARG